MQKYEALIIESAIEWIKEKKDFFICTIIAAKGASVRPLGSIFAYDGTNKIGFISEPRSDDAFCELLNEGYFKEDITTFTYGNQLLNKEKNLCLPCCGNVTLLVEKITPSSDMLKNFLIWNDLIKKRVGFQRTINKENNKSTFITLPEYYKSEEKNVINNEKSIQITYFPIIQVLIIGATPVAKHLAKQASDLGFYVKLCENRKLFLDNLAYEGVNNNFELCKEASDLFVKKRVDKHTAVVALAHDPSIDDDAISFSLNSNAFYVGAIGSSKNNNKRTKRLKNAGMNEIILSKLRAPIGLMIHSQTPTEIAVSIIAELISLRHTL